MKRKGDAGGETIRETSLVSLATPRGNQLITISQFFLCEFRFLSQYL